MAHLLIRFRHARFYPDEALMYRSSRLRPGQATGTAPFVWGTVAGGGGEIAGAVTMGRDVRNCALFKSRPVPIDH